MTTYVVQLEQTIVGFATIEAKTIDDARKAAVADSYRLMQEANKNTLGIRIVEISPAVIGRVGHDHID